MRELNPKRRAFALHEPTYSLKWSCVRIVPDAEVFRADTPVWCDCCSLGEDQPGAADRAAGQMHEVPVIREPIIARVLTHRRDGDAVIERQPAKRERLEQVCHAPILPGPTYLPHSPYPPACLLDQPSALLDGHDLLHRGGGDVVLRATGPFHVDGRDGGVLP